MDGSEVDTLAVLAAVIEAIGAEAEATAQPRVTRPWQAGGVTTKPGAVKTVGVPPITKE